jgi:glycosyltransferase involved in cell wall biosynthesis
MSDASAATDEPVTLTVAIPTYHRPEPLRRCLAAVLVQADEALEHAKVAAAEVLVIDNSADGSARASIADLLEARRDRLRYLHEPVPGIAAARNRALVEATGRLVAFVDDDEVPRPAWLEPLVETWQATGASAVMGRVHAVFERDADAWIEAGHVYGRDRMPTGTVIPVAAAGNLLLDLDAVRSYGVGFDPRFGLTGGEDTFFSRQLVAAGGTIVWCDESVADDFVPSHRFDRRWMMRRFRSHGNIDVHADVLMARGPMGRLDARVRGIARGTVRVVIGSLRFLAGAVTRSQRTRVFAVRTVCRGAGMITGAFGTFHQEYQRAGATP